MGAGTIMVTRALAEAGHPEVILIRGADFYYFLFDNVASRQNGDRLVQETSIVRSPRFDAVPVDRLVVEGIDFARRVKAATMRSD